MQILVLEDTKSTQELLRRRLLKEGHTVDAVDNGHQGFQLATSNSYDVIISDIQMPHWDGFKFIEAMQVVNPHLPIIIVTSADKDPEVSKRLNNQPNVLALLSKPFDFPTLFHLLATIQVQNHMGINKKARIVCTIGPSSNDVTTLGRMILAGMDVARLNFSHGSYEQHSATLSAVREAEKQWQKPIAVLQDLCGPKIRTGRMQSGQVLLNKGQVIVIQKKDIEGTAERISTITPEIIADLNVGDPILLDDGLLELRVRAVGAEEVTCEVIVGGILKSGKGMNLPGTSLSLPSVTPKDWADLDWAFDHSVDYVALSFVRSAQEILEIKARIAKSGRDIRVVAKIEKPEAVNHIKEIIDASDAIMIARGDMGVELPAARVPRIQQEIIRLCWQMNTPVITATQMLDSMTTNSRPTRAEVTDVSTAIREGTDAVMLSQETAIGSDPVNVVRTMASIISEEEHYSTLDHEQYEQLLENDGSSNPVLTAVSGFHHTAATLLLDPQGVLYPILSKWSRRAPSILVTRSMQIARHATLYNNIIPIIITEQLRREAAISQAITLALQMGCIRKGDLISVVEGAYVTRDGFAQEGALQLVRVEG